MPIQKQLNVFNDRLLPLLQNLTESRSLKEIAIIVSSKHLKDYVFNVITIESIIEVSL